MKTYDKNDNDTYVEILAPSLVGDVEAHMFRNPHGSVVAYGIVGDFHSQSCTIARNNVLHFPKAKDLDLVHLKNLDQNTLIPYSLMKRYNSTILSNEHRQKTPVFFNPITEQFVTPMDGRILRDLGEYANEFKGFLDPLVKDNKVSFVNNNLLLHYDSLDDIGNSKNKLFKNVKQQYEKALLNFYPTQDVILIFFRLEDNKQILSSFVPHKEMNKLDNGINNCELNFEFIKALKITDNYFYFYHLNGELNKDSVFFCDKTKTRKEANSTIFDNKDLFLGAKNDVTIIPYTDNDWNMLMNLKNNMNSLFQQLDNILLTQKNKNTNGLDGSLTDIKLNNLLLLENNNINKPKLK